MEKRHYFEVPDTLTTTNIVVKRTFTDNLVTGYNINTINYPISVAEQYSLLVALPANKPWDGVLAYSDANEAWTKDGLYLHLGGVASAGMIRVYVKDFLENMPNSYQSKMLTEISSNEKIDLIAGYLIDNAITSKEYYVVSTQGIQDQIIAYIGNTYYLNSMNDYVNYHISGLSPMYGATWAITDTVYDPIAKAAGEVSEGFRADMLLKSNKLIYLMRYEGMTNVDTVKYLETGTSNLQYLKNVVINTIPYQVYLNLNFIYSSGGTMINPLAESTWQIINVNGVFTNTTDKPLLGKVVKVW